jgi:hypothetical protein
MPSAPMSTWDKARRSAVRSMGSRQACSTNRWDDGLGAWSANHQPTGSLGRPLTRKHVLLARSVGEAATSSGSWTAATSARSAASLRSDHALPPPSREAAS